MDKTAPDLSDDRQEEHRENLFPVGQSRFGDCDDDARYDTTNESGARMI